MERGSAGNGIQREHWISAIDTSRQSDVTSRKFTRTEKSKRNPNRILSSLRVNDHFFHFFQYIKYRKEEAGKLRKFAGSASKANCSNTEIGGGGKHLSSHSSPDLHPLSGIYRSQIKSTVPISIKIKTRIDAMKKKERSQ